MFGKILVSTHVGLSLIFATWAMALYVTRVDFSTTPGKGTTPDGELVARVAEYERLKKEAVLVDRRWRGDPDWEQKKVPATGRELLLTHELLRSTDRAWYAKQLEFLKTGATEDKPVRQLKRDAAGNGELVDKPREGADLLKMEAVALKDKSGKELVLKSLEFYNREYDATNAQITVALKRLQAAADRDLKATNKLKGATGLHARINFERTKQERVKDEFEEVRPLMLKTAVELQNLEQLATRLQLRLRELGYQGKRP